MSCPSAQFWWWCRGVISWWWGQVPWVNDSVLQDCPSQLQTQVSCASEWLLIGSSKHPLLGFNWFAGVAHRETFCLLDYQFNMKEYNSGIARWKRCLGQSMWIGQGFPRGSTGEESTCNAADPGDTGSIPGSRRFPWRGKMASHSSILAWRIPWTEEPGGLQSKGSQRVGHDWMTKNPMGRRHKALISSLGMPKFPCIYYSGSCSNPVL